MSRTMDPRAQRETGRGFEPVAAPAPLSERVMDAVQSGVWHAGANWSKPLVLPDGARPLVLRSKRRGVLHRGYRLDGQIRAHARCNVLPPGEVLPKGAESWYENLSDASRLCRYPWCFRDLVRELGLIPVVGHESRRLRSRAGFAR
jgi:hypothetical protein